MMSQNEPTLTTAPECDEGCTVLSLVSGICENHSSDKFLISAQDAIPAKEAALAELTGSLGPRRTEFSRPPHQRMLQKATSAKDEVNARRVRGKDFDRFSCFPAAILSRLLVSISFISV